MKGGQMKGRSAAILAAVVAASCRHSNATASLSENRRQDALETASWNGATFDAPAVLRNSSVA